MKTNQEIFDTVLFALRKQGQASMGRASEAPSAKPVCRYRGDLGAKCAIGHLIPDEAYVGSFEGYNVFNERIARAAGLTEDQMEFAHVLQEAHDGRLAKSGLHAWEKRMREIASVNGLHYTEPTT